MRQNAFNEAADEFEPGPIEMAEPGRMDLVLRILASAFNALAIVVCVWGTGQLLTHFPAPTLLGFFAFAFFLSWTERK